MRDIRNMLNSLEIQSPQIWGEQTFANNRNMLNSLEISAAEILATETYERRNGTSEREIFKLTKELSITLVSGSKPHICGLVIRCEIETHFRASIISVAP